MGSAVLVLMFTFGMLSGQALSCGLNITGSGNISTPNFPEIYADNSRCVWKLRAESGGRLRLEFLALNLEADMDFLVAYRGDPSNESTANVYFRYSGFTLPSPVVLGESATLVFTSDDSVAYAGFFIVIKTVAASEANESTAQEANERCLAQNRFFCSRSQKCVTLVSLCNGWLDCALGEDEANCTINFETTSFPIVANSTDVGCGGNFTGSGNVSSPNYPSRHPNNFNCTWKLFADAGQVLELSILDFALEDAYDILSVYQVSQNSSNILLRRYTGFTAPGVRLILGKEAALVFTSDDSINSRGFLLSFSSIHPTGATVSPVINSTMKTVCADQGAYLCGKSSECINASAMCNGHADCMYGDDEEACNVTTSTSQPGRSVGGLFDAQRSTAVGSDGILNSQVPTAVAIASQETRTTSYASSGQTPVNDISAYASASSEVSSDLASTLRTSIGLDSRTYAPITANLTADLHIYSQSAAPNVGKETTRTTPSIVMTTTRVALQATTTSFQSGATSGKEQAACLSSADYWCNRSRHCVPVEARCNGMLECALGDDEAGCPTGITPQTASQLETTRPMLKLDISVFASSAICLRSPSHFVKELISLWILTTILW